MNPIFHLAQHTYIPPQRFEYDITVTHRTHVKGGDSTVIVSARVSRGKQVIISAVSGARDVIIKHLTALVSLEHQMDTEFTVIREQVGAS
jgi:phosphotransferase system HPr-like phosphotransfer protein